MTKCGFLSFLVENLVDKYGKGKNFVKKSQTCNYEQVIYTGGVHTSVGGSVMVFQELVSFWKIDTFGQPFNNSTTHDSHAWADK